jgi:hypothetical protein
MPFFYYYNMLLKFSASELQGCLQNPNLCPISVVEKVMLLLDSVNTSENQKTDILMALSRNEKFSKRFISKVNEDADRHGALARIIASKIVPHTAFESHLKNKCIPVKNSGKR